MIQRSHLGRNTTNTRWRESGKGTDKEGQRFTISRDLYRRQLDRWNSILDLPRGLYKEDSEIQSMRGIFLDDRRRI